MHLIPPGTLQCLLDERYLKSFNSVVIRLRLFTEFILLSIRRMHSLHIPRLNHITVPVVRMVCGSLNNSLELSNVSLPYTLPKGRKNRR